jgi:hypothetical protein
MVSLLLTGCISPQVQQGLIQVSIRADQKDYQVQIPAGSTVQDALAAAGISTSSLDRTEPPLYTLLSEGSQVRVARVSEEFYVQSEVIPYEHQVVRNESLTEGETRLSQPGVNGLREITYRRVLEDGVEVSNKEVKTTILREPVPEIMMIGSQTPFASLPIPGRLAYLSAGNAWVMEGSTGNRRPVVTTGDLDGHIFSVSPDGTWLLFSRHSTEENEINQLWTVQIDQEGTKPIPLGAVNIIHFAEWNPDRSVIGYSTVEPRSAPPGWQANNDFLTLGFSSTGFLTPPRLELEANSGGVYGWWGMDFAYAPDGTRLAYARPDSIGVFNTTEKELRTLLEIVPFQTGADWAWVPGIGWGPDGKVLYTVVHAPSNGANTPEESPVFDLVALPFDSGAVITLDSDVGMFAYPSPSPMQSHSWGQGGDTTNEFTENAYQVAYLEAVFPKESETSRYRLVVMDRDGSNRRNLFPAPDLPGMEPQKVVWSPGPIRDFDNLALAVLYQDNIWLISLADGTAQQITGDGLTSRLDWK